MSRVGDLLDLDALRRYDGLALQVHRGMGDRPGDRRFPGRRQASGAEVEAYTRYTTGDDVRHLDWNALGRLDALLTRRFTAEREVAIHLLIDCSASMGVPVRDRKHASALELAMALGYLGLSSNDAVRAALLTGAGIQRSPVLRQRSSAATLGRFLAAADAGGPLELGAALADWARGSGTRGVVIVLSDFMGDPATLAPAVETLSARTRDLYLVQIVGPGELAPEREFTGGVLRDVESGATHAVHLTPAALAGYRQLLDAHFGALEHLATHAGATYVRLRSDEDASAIVTGALARAGLVRRR